MPKPRGVLSSPEPEAGGGVLSTGPAKSGGVLGVESLGLNPQEQFIWDWHDNNLKKPVRHDDGTISTVYSMTVNVGGEEKVIPTVWGGQIVDPRVAMQYAAMVGWDKFPSYKSPQEADARYQQMHKFME